MGQEVPSKPSRRNLQQKKTKEDMRNNEIWLQEPKLHEWNVKRMK